MTEIIRREKVVAPGILTGSALLLAVLFSLPVHAVEEPVFDTVETLGMVEIRRYEPVVQARTEKSENVRSSGSFRMLARFISGDNLSGEKIEMTAPVETSLTRGESYMAFNMPEGMNMNTVPNPSDDSITLHPVPARTLAVVTFSGWAWEKTVSKNLHILFNELELHGIEPKGEAFLAQYNPPWTPPWKRRNEVMVEVAARK